MHEGQAVHALRFGFDYLLKEGQHQTRARCPLGPWTAVSDASLGAKKRKQPRTGVTCAAAAMMQVMQAAFHADNKSRQLKARYGINTLHTDARRARLPETVS
jgi:hypothetical protein